MSYYLHEYHNHNKQTYFGKVYALKPEIRFTVAVFLTDFSQPENFGGGISIELVNS